MKDIKTNINYEIQTNKDILMKFQRDLISFTEIVNKKSEQLKDELDELLILNNKQLLESMNKAEEDIKEKRVTTCNNMQEVKIHLESL